MSLPVAWEIFVAGIEATDQMNPYVEGIECSGHSGGKADSARISFNDAGGTLILPPKKSLVEIRIEGRLRFKGYTDAPECVVDRGGGMKMEVACSSMDKTGKLKQALHYHQDDCTLKDFLTSVAKKAGLKGIKVDDELGSYHRRYWSTRGRTPLRMFQMLADEYGATFKVQADQAVFAARGAGSVPGGGSTPTIIISRADNLIECRMSPYEGRYRYVKARTRYYDRKKGKWLYKDIEIGDDPGSSDTLDLTGEDRQDEDAAGRSATGRKTESQREAGSGSATILYDPDVEAEGTAEFRDVRPGIDGPYRIESWTDRITREGMAETSLEVKQPQGSTGDDEREGR